MKRLLYCMCLTACIADPAAVADPEGEVDRGEDARVEDARLEDAAFGDAWLRPDAAFLDASVDVGPVDALPPDADWQIVAEIELPGTPRDLDWLANRLYAVTAPRGLAIVNVLDPRAPRFVDAFGVQGANALALSPRDAWGVVAAVGDGVRVIDFANPDRPREVGAFDLVGAAGAEYAQDIGLDGTTAYVAAGSQGVWQVDVSNRARPRGAGSCCNPGGHPLSGPRGLTLLDGGALVADTVDGIVAVAFDDGEPPQRVTRAAMPGEAQSVRRAGDRFYALLNDDTVVSIANEQINVLAIEDTFQLPAPTTHLAVHDDRLLIGTGDGVWHIDDGEATPLLDLGGRAATSVLVRDGWMYVGVENGLIVARRGG